MTSTQSITAHRVLPVLVLDNPGTAQPVALALRDGGLPVAEVTMRTPAAIDALREMSDVDGVVVGAGTVTNADQVDQAVAAGAQFVVSPGLSKAVIHRAQRIGVPVVPGVLTPTEVMRALDLGLGLLKFFPAETGGGAGAVAALAGPFGEARFIPTGGITEQSAADYLALPSVAAIGSSWVAPRNLIIGGDFAEIRARAAAIATLARNRG